MGVVPTDLAVQLRGHELRGRRVPEDHVELAVDVERARLPEERLHAGVVTTRHEDRVPRRVELVADAAGDIDDPAGERRYAATTSSCV